jgi:hypothetical protein
MEEELPPRSIYDDFYLLADVREHLQYLHHQQMASIEFYGHQESIESTEAQSQVESIMKPKALPPTETLMTELLETLSQTDIDIDIFEKLQQCAKEELQHDFITELGDSIMMFRKNLSYCEENPCQKLMIQQRTHHTASVSTCMQLLSKILVFDTWPLQDDPDTIELSEPPKQRAQHFRQGWEQFYRQALRQHVQQFEAIRTRVREAESVHDPREIVAGRRDERRLNDHLFHDFVDQYLEDLSRPMRERENKGYDDLEESYTFFTAQRIIQQTGLHTAYQHFERLDKLQLENTETMIAQLDAIDAQAQTCDNMLSIIAKDWRKAVTRLHRLTAIDVKDYEKRKLDIAKRFQHHEAFRLVLQTQLDIAQTVANSGRINIGLNQIRKELKQVDNTVLDLYIATETALHATALEEERGNDNETMSECI